MVQDGIGATGGAIIVLPPKLPLATLLARKAVLISLPAQLPVVVLSKYIVYPVPVSARVRIPEELC